MIIAMYFLMSAVIIIADQLSKWWALTNVLEHWDITSFLSFEVMLNKGISWSMFDGEYTPWFVYCAIAAMIVFLLVHIITQNKIGITTYAEVAVLAGAISNTVDRILYGGVVDFITFHYHNWYFPSFNIADIAITLGVMFMIIQLIQER